MVYYVGSGHRRDRWPRGRSLLSQEHLRLLGPGSATEDIAAQPSTAVLRYALADDLSSLADEPGEHVILAKLNDWLGL